MFNTRIQPAAYTRAAPRGSPIFQGQPSAQLGFERRREVLLHWAIHRGQSSLNSHWVSSVPQQLGTTSTSRRVVSIVVNVLGFALPTSRSSHWLRVKRPCRANRHNHESRWSRYAELDLGCQRVNSIESSFSPSASAIRSRPASPNGSRSQPQLLAFLAASFRSALAVLFQLSSTEARPATLPTRPSSGLYSLPSSDWA
jgi:hypothetical protein